MKHNALEITDHFEINKDNYSKLLYGTLIDNPDLCIVVPVYGWRIFLEETLLSIKKQLSDDLNVQIIISDNANNPDLFISKLKELDLQNVAYYKSEKELGQFGNMNRAIELANSEYVAMVHDDDLLASDYINIIKKILPYLENNQDIGLIHERFDFFNSDSNPKDVNNNDSVSFYRINSFMVSLHGSSLTGVPSCGYLLRKSIFIKTGGFNEKYKSSGDSFPSAIMMLKKYKVYQFNNVTGYYRVEDNSSLKLNICKGFIKDDYEFGKAWAQRGSFARKIFMRFFENYRYSRNIENKVATFGKINKEITIRNLDYLKKYKKYKINGFVAQCFLLFCRLNAILIKKSTIVL